MSDIITEINRISRKIQKIPDTEILIPSGYIYWDLFKKTNIVYLLEEHYKKLIPTLEYTTCTVDEAKVVSVKKTRKLGLSNPGRAKGFDPEVYDLVKKNHKFGWNIAELPPFIFADESNPVNGNHRFKYYDDNGVGYVPVYKVTPKEGFTKNDVINELGLKFQERAKGTPAKFEDYKVRGITWYIEQKKLLGGNVEKQKVRDWVKWIADFETTDTQERLVNSIFNATEKQSFLTNYDRRDAIKLFKEKKGIKISRAGTTGHANVVHRLVSAEAYVHVARDFFQEFVRDAGKKVITHVHFYVNTNKCDDPLHVINKINARIKEIEDYIDDIGSVNKEAAKSLRDHLVYGYRPPHIVSLDKGNLQPVR